MADPVKVKKYLGQLEDNRKNGRPTEPPARFKLGNLLGGETDAFNEAVKQQGAPPTPAPANGVWADAEEEEKRVKAFQKRRQ